MTSEATMMTVKEPQTPQMKRRRGRPPSNKKAASVIGESSFSVEMNNSFENDGETDENRTAKVSEATLKKGFQSTTAVMKLSPLKNVKKNKSILLDLSNCSTNNVNANIEKVHNDSPRSIFNSRILETPDRQGKHDENYGSSNCLSSSPMSNMMSNDMNYQESSPLRTSPLPSGTGYNSKTNNNIQNSLQSSPWMGYEDQFNKYINSSPLCAVNSPHNVKSPRVVSKVKRAETQKKVEKLDLARYRFNYQYRITLDINERGVAQLFARVLEDSNYYQNNKNGPQIEDQNMDLSHYMHHMGYDNSRNAEYQYIKENANNEYENDDGIMYAYEQGIYQEGIVPSRFEQYMESCRRYNQEREEIIQNCMKNDVFLTTSPQYSSVAASAAVFSSPRRDRQYSQQSIRCHHQQYSPNNLSYINSRVNTGPRTVNINHIITNNMGISAGIQHDASLKLYQDIHRQPIPSTRASNDALAALQAAALSSPESV